MKFVSGIFTPTKNRRLNELIGFLFFVCALLFFLSLISYSPLDPSLNTASARPAWKPTHNWIGVVGSYFADCALQMFGIAVFMLPVFLFVLGTRWWRSRNVDSWIAKALGSLALFVFFSGLIGLFSTHWRWMHAVPVEGLLGRIVADVLIQLLNVTGAYIVSLAAIAVALYLCTAFSFGQLKTWLATRFAFVFALRERYRDWQAERAKVRAAKELEKRRAAKPTIATKLIPAKPAAERPIAGPPPVAAPAPMPSVAPLPKSGIERELENHDQAPLAPAHYDEPAEPTVTNRADTGQKAKTTMPRIAGGYKLPSTALLHRPDGQFAIDEEELKELAKTLVEKCAEFDVHGQVTQINPGPVVTTFEMKPEAGIKYSRFTSLSDDLCLALKAESILIERMSGKSTVGIQVPNRERETIWLRELIESQEFASSKSKLTLAVGKDINGRMNVADMATMPHLLIAGSTGSGKSVAINAFIMSMLYKSTPDQVRLILVDPKRVELGMYDGVPHLYVPIITEPKLAANALRNAVREMERRLKLLASRGVRNIDQYNKLFDGQTPSLFDDGTQQEGPIPYIIIIIDELADLMMLDQSNVEESITRLAQMARAVGIHLVLATQRPSVDVITGLIKANFPARMSFRVATKVDSRTILDGNGAEALLGRGDMLYLPSGSSRVLRLHAPFVTEKEIHSVVEFWKAQGTAQYQQQFLEAPKDENGKVEGGMDGDSGEPEHDELFEDAVRLVLEFGKASTSLLQRRLRIGYGRAAHLIDLMERDGIVGAADGPKPREVLKRPDWITEVEQSLR
ncbi:MAG TPA: DNA translocase FtsK [Terriglobales bacterium]|nr:DNA translocase FtsK [Terriglobales bacterium]